MQKDGIERKREGRGERRRRRTLMTGAEQTDRKKNRCTRRAKETKEVQREGGERNGGMRREGGHEEKAEGRPRAAGQVESGCPGVGEPGEECPLSHLINTPFISPSRSRPSVRPFLSQGLRANSSCCTSAVDAYAASILPACDGRIP